MQEENGGAMEVVRLELHRRLSEGIIGFEMISFVRISRLPGLRRYYGIGVDSLAMEIRWNRVL